MLDDRLGVTVGLDILEDETRQMLVETGRTYVPESRYSNIAPFLQGQFKIADPLTLHAAFAMSTPILRWMPTRRLTVATSLKITSR